VDRDRAARRHPARTDHGALTMPRITELQGYRFAVTDTTVPEIDPNDGQIIYGMDGQPKLQQAKQIILFDQLGDQVKITLPDDARRQLVEMLTGGVLVPEIEVVKH
jgi:hypothetical protein